MAQAAEDNRHFSVTLPRTTTERLDGMASERGCSRSDIVREAVFAYLKTLDRQHRRAS